MRRLKRYLLIALGVFLMAFGTVHFAERASLVTGGAAGLSIAILEVLEWLNIKSSLFILTSLINIPLFVMGARIKGVKFIGISFYAALLFSVFLGLCEKIPNFIYDGKDILVASVMTGVFVGAGLGIALKNGATTGGTDLLAYIIKAKSPHLKISTIINVVDTIIILFGVFVFGIGRAVYAVLAVFITTTVMNFIIEGGQAAKGVYVFSENTAKIAERIMTEKKRGVTAFYARGMYKRIDKKVLFTVISEKEIPAVINIIKEIDEKAFVVINDVREVLGEGFN